MTTVSQAERLARKITEALGQPPSESQTAKLAQEYADLCRAANRRLEQCALMIEAGQSLQALQLAETPPPLLDLITVLSFRQAAEWRAFCQTHELPFGEAFYDKHVRLLNSAYGKGIASDHPYYRDYRRAVMTHNDEQALSILRVIARMNPSDQNTREELKRVEEKLLRVKLEKLAESVGTGDAAATQAEVKKIESSGVAVPSTHPVWQQAQVARCQELLRCAEELGRKDDWRATEALVDEIHSLATHYNVQLPAADADSWTALEAWTADKRGAFAREQDFQRALSALEYELQTVESKRAKGTPLGLDVAKNQINSLTTKWNDADRFGRQLDGSLNDRRRQAVNWLQGQLDSANRRRRVAIGVTVAVVAAIIISIIPSIRAWTGEETFLHRLTALESSRRVSETEALVSQVSDRIKVKPRANAAILKTRDFIAHEKELKQAFDQGLSGLQQREAGAFHNDLDQVAARRAETGHALEQIAPEFQADGKKDLQDWDAKWQLFRNAALAEQLNQAESVAAGLKGTNGYEAVRTALIQIKSILARADTLKFEPPALDPNLQGRISALNGKVDTWTANSERWEKAQAALANAESLEDYMDRLDQMVKSPFATDAQRDAAVEIDQLKITREMLLGELLMPERRGSWDTLTNASVWRASLMPEQPTAREKDAYFKLRDDKNMQNVFVYQLVANNRANNPYRTHLVYVSGSLNRDRGGQMAGPVYDPQEFQDTSRFLSETYSDWDYAGIIKSNRTQECESFERIGLAELIDPNTGNYQKPILQLFDQLNRDENSSAIFRAFVTLKLYALAEMRPEDWGLQWCPAAPRHIQALKDLGALDLKSGDWMVQAPMAKYGAPLEKYFDRIRGLSFEKQAQLLEQLAQQTCQTDFSFAGYIDVGGHPVTRRSNLPTLEYWGWGSNPESAVLLLHKGREGNLEQAAAPLPFTPLFTFNGDRRRLLAEALSSIAFPVNQTAGILPPFFSGLYE